MAKPIQDMPTSTESQQSNLVAAADSVRLILQDLGTTASERPVTDEQESIEHLTTIPDQENVKGDEDINDSRGFDQEWENIDMLSLSKDCSTDDDKISKCFCLSFGE